MNRAVRYTLAAGAVVLVCACTSDSLKSPIGIPQASLSDGAHSGNPDFFFLPPIFKNPSSDPNFTPGAFNATVQPTVEICRLAPADPLAPPGTIRPCAVTITTFGAADVRLDASNQQYQVNWDTKASNLDVTKEYRIRVLLGVSTELGYADVDPIATGAGLKRVDNGEFIGLLDGRTLPIKFRIETGAACNGGACNSKTIDLSQGGFVVLATTGDRVDIPAQQSGQTVNITVQQCAGLDIDLPLFGNCLRVTADPPLAARLAPAATVSMCSLNPLSLPANHAQAELVTLHRQDGEVVLALPHSTDFCTPAIGRSQSNVPGSLAARGWRRLRDVAAWIFKPATLHASTMMFDVGAGGQTDGFSDFQFALPVKMEITSLADQTGTPNGIVPSVPTVLVTDALGNVAAGARVHFQVTSGSGSSIVPAAGVVMTGAEGSDAGKAALTQWTLGAAGSYALQAYGKGIAVRGTDGPGEGFDPFTPAIFHNAEEDEEQLPVTLETGRLTYNATAGVADLIIESLTQLPATPTDLELIEYTAVVKNVGTAPAGHFMVLINVHEVVNGDPGRGIEATSLSSGPPTTSVLNPGETISLRRQRTLELNAGDYQLTGIADANSEVAESNESNNTLATPFAVGGSGEFLVRPITTFYASAPGISLPLIESSGISMQPGAAVQIEFRPGESVSWSSSDLDGTIGTVDDIGLVRAIQGSGDPASANEFIVTGTGATAGRTIKINSFAFDHFPRLTTLVWQPVARATSYEVQVDFGNGCTEGTAVCTRWTPQFGFPARTSLGGLVFSFVGAQPGRWRVIAQDAAGATITTSEYAYFVYLH